MSCSLEINLIEINFSPSVNLLNLLNNLISFSNSIILLICGFLFDMLSNSFIFLFKLSFFNFSSFIILSFSFIFNSNSFIYFSNSFILSLYSLSLFSEDSLFTLIILIFSLLLDLTESSFIKSRNVFDSYFNYIKNNILPIKLI